MYLRFVTERIERQNGLPEGVFAAAYELWRADDILDFERAEIRKTLDWFETHLPIPKRLARSRKPNREATGICWFKADARQCVRQVRYLVQLVEEQGIVVRELRTDSPGYRIYEDEFQVVVAPFSSSPR